MTAPAHPSLNDLALEAVDDDDDVRGVGRGVGEVVAHDAVDLPGSAGAQLQVPQTRARLQLEVALPTQCFVTTPTTAYFIC